MLPTPPPAQSSPTHPPAAAASPPAHFAETPATHPETTRRYAPATPRPASDSRRLQSTPHPKSCGAVIETAASPPARHLPTLPPRYESASSQSPLPATSAAKLSGSSSLASSFPRPAAR